MWIKKEKKKMEKRASEIPQRQNRGDKVTLGRERE